MDADMIYSTYHNLWRIEESFKIMKSYLDACPVHMQGKDSICGHFLICYLSVLLSRLLQLKVLNNKYINWAASTDFIKSLVRNYELPITNYFLTYSQIKKVLTHKF